MTSIVGIVPAAGLGTRLGLASGSKETLSVGGRPLIRYLLDRLAVGGASRIRVVTRPAKRDVAALARRLGHEVVLAETDTVSATVLAGLAGVADADIVLLGFPDSIWEPIDGFRSIRDRVEAGAGLVLGLFRSDEPERSDVVSVDDRGRVSGISIKPRHPTSDLIWGCLAARAAVLGRLRPSDELSAFIVREAASATSAGGVGGTGVPTIRLGRILDVGTRASLAAAATDPLVRGSPRPGR